MRADPKGVRWPAALMLLLAGVAGAQTWKDLAAADPAKVAIDSAVANGLMFRCGALGSEG